MPTGDARTLVLPGCKVWWDRSYVGPGAFKGGCGVFRDRLHRPLLTPLRASKGNEMRGEDFSQVLDNLVLGRRPFENAVSAPSTRFWQRVKLWCQCESFCFGERLPNIEASPPALHPPPPLPPRQRDAMFGRVDELAAIHRFFEDGRLLSLHGPAGVGKTRLAIHYAWSALEASPGEVQFCDLAHAATLYDMLGVVSDTLGVPIDDAHATVGDRPGSGGDRALVDRVGRAIGARAAGLVILDNFEQLGPDCASALDHWLTIGDARFLVTTRTLLGMRGEGVVAVAPLPVGLPEDPDAVNSDGCRMLADRIAAASGSAPHDLPASQLAQLAHALDGLPLAIELAASRARIVPVADLWKHVARDAGNGGGGRHASLETALEPSWTPLPEHLRSAVGRLAVFEGGVTAAAAQEVLELGSEGSGSATLGALVDSSWVQRIAGQPSPRFDLLPSIRAFVTNRMSDAVRSSAELGHAAWAVRVAERASADDTGEARTELANLLAACERAIRRVDGPTAVRTLEAIGEVLSKTGPYRRGDALARRVAGLPLSPADDLRTKRIAGEFAWLSGDLDQAEACFAFIHASTGDGKPHPAVLGRLGDIAFRRGQADVARHFAEDAFAACDQDPAQRGPALLRLAALDERAGEFDLAESKRLEAASWERRRGDVRAEAVALEQLGVSLQRRPRRLDEAFGALSASAALFEQAGDVAGQTHVLGNLAIVDQKRGNQDLDPLRRAVEAHRWIGDATGEAVMLNALGALLGLEQSYEEAEDCLRRSILIHVATGGRTWESRVRGNLGLLFRDLGRYSEALSELEAARRSLADIGSRAAEASACVKIGRVLTDLERYDEAWSSFKDAVRLELSEGRSVEADMSLGHLGRVQWRVGRPRIARALLRRVVRPVPAAEPHEEFSRASFAGTLAEVEAALGNRDEAERILMAADAALRQRPTGWELAALLCSRARVFADAPDEHRRCVEAAEAIATASRAPDGGPVRSDIARTRALGVAAGADR